jgi:hypothetical protein
MGGGGKSSREGMTRVVHVRIWQFRPAPDREAEFVRAYGDDGDWAQLFRRGEGYLGTSLLAPSEPGGPWLTLDRWTSRSSFEEFQARSGGIYRRLDAELSGLAREELFVGAFEE